MFETLGNILGSLDFNSLFGSGDYNSVKSTDVKVKFDNEQQCYILYKNGNAVAQISKKDMDNMNYQSIFSMLGQLLEVSDEDKPEENNVKENETNDIHPDNGVDIPSDTLENTKSSTENKKCEDPKLSGDSNNVELTFAEAFTEKYSNYKKYNTTVLIDSVMNDLIKILQDEEIGYGLKYTLLYGSPSSDICEGIRLVYYRNWFVDPVKNSFKNPENISTDAIIQRIMQYVDTTMLEEEIKLKTGFNSIRVSFYEGFENSAPIMCIVLGNNQEFIKNVDCLCSQAE